jgi:hypothetical protein
VRGEVLLIGSQYWRRLLRHLQFTGPALLVLFLLLGSSAASAQGCALCYTQAAASGNRMIHALQQGIIILVVPPMFLSILFTALVFKKRNEFRNAEYPHTTTRSGSRFLGLRHLHGVKQTTGMEPRSEQIG